MYCMLPTALWKRDGIEGGGRCLEFVGTLANSLFKCVSAQLLEQSFKTYKTGNGTNSSSLQTLGQCFSSGSKLQTRTTFSQTSSISHASRL